MKMQKNKWLNFASLLVYLGFASRSL